MPAVSQINTMSYKLHGSIIQMINNSNQLQNNAVTKKEVHYVTLQDIIMFAFKHLCILCSYIIMQDSSRDICISVSYCKRRYDHEESFYSRRVHSLRFSSMTGCSMGTDSWFLVGWEVPDLWSERKQEVMPSIKPLNMMESHYFGLCLSLLALLCLLLHFSNNAFLLCNVIIVSLQSCLVIREGVHV